MVRRAVAVRRSLQGAELPAPEAGSSGRVTLTRKRHPATVGIFEIVFDGCHDIVTTDFIFWGHK